jgi:hypothetical protein
LSVRCSFGGMSLIVSEAMVAFYHRNGTRSQVAEVSNFGPREPEPARQNRVRSPSSLVFESSHGEGESLPSRIAGARSQAAGAHHQA